MDVVEKAHPREQVTLRAADQAMEVMLADWSN
jgi:hypothetical protein